MRIVEIEIEDLFGTFHHRIPLNTEDRVTILHGPNGFGKTILLEMVHGLFSGRYETLWRIPFHQLSVGLDDGTRILVRKKVAPIVLKKRRPSVEHEISIVLENGIPRHRKQLHEFNLPAMALADSTKPARLSKMAWELFIDTKDDSDPSATQEEEPPWWQKIRSSLTVAMIREQRLQVRSVRGKIGLEERSALVPAIEEYSTELAQSLQKKLAESVELSQSLDRTFPARLLERIHEKGPSDLELTKKLGELERKREKMTATGLLDEQEELPFLPTEKLDDETRDVLAVYIEDAEKKLSVFDDLARKIELFQNIINSRFLYKSLRISREKGFIFTTSGGETLALNALSSGEQQEIVLLFELLFRLKPNSLVLIDEPELSLHVAWQKKFLEDLTQITELASFDVLIATHSPQIIHKRWDLTVELESPKIEAELATASVP